MKRFKDTLQDKTCYIIGSGPSHLVFKREKKEKDVYLGVNNVGCDDYLSKFLDFLFVERLRNIPLKVSNNTMVFYDSEQFELWEGEHFHVKNPIKATPYDYNELYCEINFLHGGSQWNGQSTTVFIAILFALYCGSRNIVLVGCDCSDKYYHLVAGWEAMASYVKRVYNDSVEIKRVGCENIAHLFDLKDGY